MSKPEQVLMRVPDGQGGFMVIAGLRFHAVPVVEIASEETLMDQEYERRLPIAEPGSFQRYTGNEPLYADHGLIGRKPHD